MTNTKQINATRRLIARYEKELDRQKRSRWAGAPGKVRLITRKLEEARAELKTLQRQEDAQWEEGA